jgi:hypothetical protein
MSLELWKTNRWLREYETSAQEVARILALIERDLEDATKKEISTDILKNKKPCPLMN